MSLINNIIDKVIGPEEIDIETAFNLWNLLVARYESLESAQMFKNFVHDKDFILILEIYIKNYKDQINVLEQETEKFKVKLPTRPAAEFKTSVKINEFTDKFIYKRMFSDMMNEMFSLARTVRTTLTNDRLRKLFVKYLFSHLSDFNSLYEYGKLKGWEEVTPAYKNPKPQGKGEISVSGAFHIWDHIDKRNQQLELTLFFEGLANDKDFIAAMTLAVSTLKKQVAKLEKLALQFEIPLPERPPASMKVMVDPEAVEDRFMYREIFLGIDNMVDMHIRATVEILRNDQVRDIFTDFFKEEIDIHDSFVKYGKLKGWLNVPPIHNPSSST
jgi:hypothetical protein